MICNLVFKWHMRIGLTRQNAILKTSDLPLSDSITVLTASAFSFDIAPSTWREIAVNKINVNLQYMYYGSYTTLWMKVHNYFCYWLYLFEIIDDKIYIMYRYCWERSGQCMSQSHCSGIRIIIYDMLYWWRK